MGRLTTLQSELATMPARISTQRDAHGHSRTIEHWRGWYNLARWKALRMRVFTRDLFTCQWPGCGVIIGDTSQLVADHIEPHHGNQGLFWDEQNVQTLCKPCHDKAKQAEERVAKWGGGAPVVPSTPGTGSGVMARPAWFRQVQVPLTVVCGPPGAGKSTYVREHAGPADLVICFDELAAGLFGRSGTVRPQASLTPAQIADVLRVRNERLGDLMRSKAKGKWPAAWLILSEPVAAHRTWWASTTGASIIVLATPAEECRRRMRADTERGDERGASAQASLSTWWRSYAPAPCDRTLTP